MAKSDLSTEEKLKLLLEAVALIATSSEDEFISLYCAKLLEELGEFNRIEQLAVGGPEEN